MVLIAKTKVLSYIKQYPEARTALLIWVKEFNNDVNRTKIATTNIGISYSEHTLFGDFRVRLTINNWLKIALITWFGTTKELEVLRDQELKKMKEKFPDLITQSVTFTNGAKRNLKSKVLVNESPEYEYWNDDLLKNYQHKSDFNFEEAIKRIFEIITAQPDSDEFIELFSTASQIRDFENSNLYFPTLSPLEIIKFKLEERHMVPQDLVKLIGSEEEVIAIFSGATQLTKGIIGKLYRKFKINI